MTANLINNEKHFWLACAKPWIQLPVTTPSKKQQQQKTTPKLTISLYPVSMSCVYQIYISVLKAHIVPYDVLILPFSELLRILCISYHFTICTCFTTNIFLPQMFVYHKYTHMYIYVIYVYMHTHIHITNIYVYIYMHTHIHHKYNTHTHIYICEGSFATQPWLMLHSQYSPCFSFLSAGISGTHIRQLYWNLRWSLVGHVIWAGLICISGRASFSESCSHDCGIK